MCFILFFVVLFVIIYLFVFDFKMDFMGAHTAGLETWARIYVVASVPRYRV
jgi:hypothetical protein